MNASLWGADVWYVVVSSDGVCNYPQAATGDKEAINFIVNLDGFDEKECIKAMGSTFNARFLCWEK